MKGDICRVCQGLGEAQVLSNPQDPEDGSYELVSCPACKGTGLRPGEGWAKLVPKPERSDTLKKAIEVMNEAFKQSRPLCRPPTDPERSD